MLRKQKKTAQVNFDIDVKKYEVDAHENFELPFECRISTDPKVLSMAFSSGLVKLGEEELKTLQGATGTFRNKVIFDKCQYLRRNFGNRRRR